MTPPPATLYVDLASRPWTEPRPGVHGTLSWEEGDRRTLKRR